MAALQITKVNTPAALYEYKCPYAMAPNSLTIHETGNFATAMSEISYMLSNTNYVSYHFAVDDERAVQGLPLDRIGYHSGDGSGPGNFRSIGIETCFNFRNGQLTNNDPVYNAKYLKARANVIELAAQLCAERNWYPKMGVTLFRHLDRNGKNCPQRIIADGYWAAFCQAVEKRYLEIKKGVAPVDNNKVIAVTKEPGMDQTLNQIGMKKDGKLLTVVIKKVPHEKMAKGMVELIRHSTWDILTNGNVFWLEYPNRLVTKMVGITKAQRKAWEAEVLRLCRGQYAKYSYNVVSQNSTYDWIEIGDMTKNWGAVSRLRKNLREKYANDFLSKRVYYEKQADGTYNVMIINVEDVTKAAELAKRLRKWFPGKTNVYDDAVAVLQF